MSDVVFDSSVVTKWFLPEADSPSAEAMATATRQSGGSLIVLDLALPEVVNAIWKRCHRNLIALEEARRSLDDLLRSPVQIEPAAPLLAAAFEIAVQYDRAVYDALFVALVQESGVQGVTADEPLFNSIHLDFPQILLLRHC